MINASQGAMMDIFTPVKLKIFTIAVPLIIMSGLGCTTAELELLEGVLGQVDAVNGAVTIVTEDGRTVTLTIDTEASVETNQGTAAVEALVPGTHVQVTLNEDGEVIRGIKAHLAEIEGKIVGIEGDKVTVENERGREVTVTVAEGARIKLDGDVPGKLADLRVGMEVEVRYDPENDTALRIDTEEEEVEIEGAVVEIAGKEVTIETQKGRRITVVVEDQTRIDLDDDVPGQLSDLKKGMEIEVRLDPFSRQAFEIEVEEGEAAAEIEGTVLEVKGNEVTVQTEKGLKRTVTITDLTRVELEDDLLGELEDLQKGNQVEVKFNPNTNIAVRVDVKD